jgi:hypothetical protein
MNCVAITAYVHLLTQLVPASTHTLHSSKRRLNYYARSLLHAYRVYSSVYTNIVYCLRGFVFYGDNCTQCTCGSTIIARNIDAEDTHTLFSFCVYTPCAMKLYNSYGQSILLQVSKELVYLLWLHTVLREP